MGKLRVYCLKTLNKLSIYPLGNTPSAPSIKDDGAQSTAVLYSQLQRGIGFFLARVVTDDPPMKCSTLIRIQTVTSQLVACHLADSMNKVMPVKVFESVLVRIVGIGMLIEVMGRGVLNTIFITSVLRKR